MHSCDKFINNEIEAKIESNEDQVIVKTAY